MSRLKQKGYSYSGVMHLLLIALLIIGLPDFFFDDPIEEPTAISVEILPIAAVSNVRPSKSTPVKKPKEEEKPPEDKEDKKLPDEPKAEKKKASPKVKVDEPEPEPPEAITPDEKKDAVKKKKKDKKKKKKKDDPLDAILKSVQDTASTEAKKVAKTSPDSSQSAKKKSRSTGFNPNSPEAMTIRDNIQSQIYKCWNVPAGVRSAGKLIIPLKVDYNKAGNPVKVVLASSARGRYNSDNVYRAATDSAKRAVRMCSPLKGMPPASYDIWQYVDMNFNPKDMLL